MCVCKEKWFHFWCVRRGKKRKKRKASTLSMNIEMKINDDEREPLWRKNSLLSLPQCEPFLVILMWGNGKSLCLLRAFHKNFGFRPIAHLQRSEQRTADVHDFTTEKGSLEKYFSTKSKNENDINDSNTGIANLALARDLDGHFGRRGVDKKTLTSSFSSKRCEQWKLLFWNNCFHWLRHRFLL